MLFKSSNILAGAIVAAATLTTAIPLSQQQQLKQNTLNAKKNYGAIGSSSLPPDAVASAYEGVTAYTWADDKNAYMTATVNSTDDCSRVELAAYIDDDKYCGKYFKSKLLCLANLRGAVSDCQEALGSSNSTNPTYTFNLAQPLSSAGIKVNTDIHEANITLNHVNIYFDLTMRPLDNSIADGMANFSMYGNATALKDCLAFASVVTGPVVGICDYTFLDFIGPPYGRQGDRELCIVHAGFEVAKCLDNFRGDGSIVDNGVYPYPFHFEVGGAVTREVLKEVIIDDGSAPAPPAGKKNAGTSSTGINAGRIPALSSNRLRNPIY
ncbi:hypothetical protein HDU76_009425 [Blyttiomyces sp. JEL0837]|nr:hypothetical protein HDU76_009425 [Blyttiomyces sp. JEL0837]